MFELISGNKYLYWGKTVTFLRAEADGFGALFLIFEVDGKEKYWEAFVHLKLKPIGQRQHSDVELPQFIEQSYTPLF